MSNYFNPDSSPYYRRSDHRVAVVTGCSIGGIGYYIALHLYRHGYIVYVTGRSLERMEASIKRIRKEAVQIAIKRRSEMNLLIGNNDSEKSGLIYSEESSFGELKMLLLDLLDLKSIRKAVEAFNKQERKVDLVINNAGIMASPFEMTKDGFEIQMQVNYVGPVLFTELLINKLEQADNPRVVLTSSIGHNFAFKDFDPSSTFDYKPNIFFTFLRYGLAKTFCIHFMKILSLKHPKILSLCVHPGFVMDTRLFSYWTSLPILGVFFGMFFQSFGLIFGVSIEKGALATLKAAMDDSLDVTKDQGKYFVTGGIEGTVSRVAADMNYAVTSYTWAIKELKSRGFQVEDA